MKDLEGALRLLEAAWSYCDSIDCAQDVSSHRDQELYEFTESDLLREAAWVILCSGFRESVVRKVFSHVSLCFCDWESSEAILKADPACQNAASASFNNTAKLRAIVSLCRILEKETFAEFKSAVISDPIFSLKSIPFIGTITAFHLAKNLGFDCAKHDRHLASASKTYGFQSTLDFCRELSEASGEKVKVIDFVIWRFIADNPDVYRSGLLLRK